MGIKRLVVGIGRYLGPVLVLLLPAVAGANDTCNGVINIDYVGAPPQSQIGDAVDLFVRFGTGSIQNGTKLTISSFQLELDCNSNDPLTPPCTDEGAIMQYESIIGTTCPTTWTSSHPVGPDPNEVIVQANTPFDIPADTPATNPGFCSITLRTRVLGASIDGDGAIQQLVGYKIARCDNGVLVSGGFQTAQITTPPPLHFDCYEFHRNSNPEVSVTLQDRFGSTSAKIGQTARLCAPTNKNGEDPGAEASPEHLLAYTLKGTTGAYQKPKGLKLQNQFGTLSANVVAPIFLDVPSSKSLAAPAPPPLVGAKTPHFQCYKLDNVKAPAPQDIALLDQFGGLTPDIDKRGPFRLCVPVNMNGGDPSAPANPNVLVCYTTRNDRLPFSDLPVFVNNPLGPTSGKITQFDELCVPSTIMP